MPRLNIYMPKYIKSIKPQVCNVGMHPYTLISLPYTPDENLVNLNSERVTVACDYYMPKYLCWIHFSNC